MRSLNFASFTHSQIGCIQSSVINHVARYGPSNAHLQNTYVDPEPTYSAVVRIKQRNDSKEQRYCNKIPSSPTYIISLSRLHQPYEQTNRHRDWQTTYAGITHPCNSMVQLKTFQRKFQNRVLKCYKKFHKTYKRKIITAHL